MNTRRSDREVAYKGRRGPTPISGDRGLLRSRRVRESNLPTTTDEYQAIFSEAQSAGAKISATGFAIIYSQMRQLGLDGLPYVDCKTFAGWKEAGFKVKKGEHSNLLGITWISAGKKESDDEGDGYKFPKAYHLFHRTQVMDA